MYLVPDSDVDAGISKDAPALQDGAEVVRYGELTSLISERVRQLRASGAGEGKRVAVVAHREIRSVISMLATLTADCLLVPLPSDTPENARLELAHQCGADFLADCEAIHVVAKVSGEAVDAEARLGLLSSGSTGKPKLVLRSGDQIRSALSIYAQSVGLNSADKVLASVPLDHSYGCNNVILSTLSVGGCVVFPRNMHPRALAEQVVADGITLFPGAPSLFDLVTRFCCTSGIGGNSLRACISVGTALSLRIHDAFTRAFGLPLWQSYGSSEAGPLCLNRDGTPDGELLALGKPCDGVEMVIQGDDGPVAAGENGEIVVKSAAVGIGYEGQHDGASRIEPGVFFTGDLGCERNGTFFFRGRRKLLIAAGGNKIDPAEVEAVLRLHEMVADAAVIGHRDDAERECVKALIVRRGPLEMVDVFDYCAQRLAPAKVPRIVEFRESLPRNAMGKLQRDKL